MNRTLRTAAARATDLTLLIGAAAVVGTAAACDTRQPQAPPASPLAVTSQELWALYSARFKSKAATERANVVFNATELIVDGVVTDIDLDAAGYPVLMIASNEGQRPVRAELTPALQMKAANLTRGQEMVFRCRGVADVAGGPMLRNCSYSEQDGKE